MIPMLEIFVFDTNTLLSALILPGSVPDRAFRKADARGRLAISEPTFDELQAVIARPKFDRYIPLADRLRFLENLANTAIQIPVIHTVTDCRDPKDNKFLELALSAPATLIASGDSDLLVLHPFQDIPILTPADFLLF
jgi:uncharacterized protein